MNKLRHTPYDGINLYHEAGQLSITRKWSDPYSGIQVIFIVALDFFFIFIASLVLRDIRQQFNEFSFQDLIVNIAYLMPDLFTLVPPFLFGCATIAINYYVIAVQVNTTVININNDFFMVADRPLPVWANKKIQSNSIRKLYVAKFTTRGRVIYRLRAITDSGKNIKIIDGIHNYEEALFIRREIKNHLDLIAENNKP